MPSLFGWDLLYKSVENDIKSNQDILVCLTHLVLVSNGFKCIGIGESKNIDGNEQQSEGLPKGWNDDYAIRYTYQGRLYNLKGTRLDDGIIINLIRVNERNVSMVQLNTRMVTRRTGPLDDMIPDNSNIVDVIKKQLIEKVSVSKKSQDSASQTNPEKTTGPSRGIDNPISPLCENRGFPQPMRPLVNPGVGANDLNPFGGIGIGPMAPGIGGGGGGMLYVGPGSGPPMGPSVGLPPGAIPPGARFDPFRPPEIDRYRPGPRRPDNDEFPPPGYDDMYM